MVLEPADEDTVTCGWRARRCDSTWCAASRARMDGREHAEPDEQPAHVGARHAVPVGAADPAR